MPLVCDAASPKIVTVDRYRHVIKVTTTALPGPDNVASVKLTLSPAAILFHAQASRGQLVVYESDRLLASLDTGVLCPI